MKRRNSNVSKNPFINGRISNVQSFNPIKQKIKYDYIKSILYLCLRI